MDPKSPPVRVLLDDDVGDRARGNSYVVHVDIKSDEELRDEISAFLAKRDNAHQARNPRAWFWGFWTLPSCRVAPRGFLNIARCLVQRVLHLNLGVRLPWRRA